ncbi:MAG: amidase domain-containing protein [Clostridia bacterium]|nr:amidase domain-containing protein [Clostridia bacterium]
MLVIKPYRRDRAVEYARKYAFGQNPVFGNFRGIGGNCTNFVSQSIYAGSCVMNYKPTYGWYYISLDNRAPAWTGVDFFYNFMTQNTDVGPFGSEVPRDALENGDVIQLGRNDDGYYHTLLVVGFDGEDPLVAAQTDDAYARPLSTYTYDFSRFIKIDGVRVEVADSALGVDCFESVFNGVEIVTPPGVVLPEPTPTPEPSET